jgi:hypothetical protein
MGASGDQARWHLWLMALNPIGRSPDAISRLEGEKRNEQRPLTSIGRLVMKDGRKGEMHASVDAYADGTSAEFNKIMEFNTPNLVGSTAVD